MFFLSDEMPFSFDEMLLFGAASGGKLVEDTATGNPLTFTTDVAKALKTLSIPFLPVQSGTGDPSPSNVRDIVPWEGLTVWQSIETGTFVQGGIADQTGGNSTSQQRIRTDYLSTSALSEDENTFELYGIGYDENEPVLRMVHFYDANKTWIRGNDSVRNKHTAKIAKSAIPNNAVYYRASVQKSDTGENITPDGVVLFVNKKAVYPVTFHSPVYGGTLDAVTGVLTVEYGIVPLDTVRFYAVLSGFFASYANLPAYADRTKLMCNAYKVVSKTHWDDMLDCEVMGIPEGGIIRIKDESCEDIDALYAKLTDVGAVFVYPLTDPQTIQLTPEQITALVGNNTLWSDANGDMTAVFFKKA